MADEQQPGQPVQPESRPQPRYGELAPEGWTWTPPEAAGAQASDAPQGETPSPQFPAAQGAPQPQGQMPGVPHNLGVGSPGAAPPAAPPVQQAPGQQGQQSYRADPPPHYQQPAWQTPPPVDTKRGDRIATIILLAVGALGALYLASSLYLMTSSFHLFANLFGIDDLTVPSAVNTISTVGALVMLVLYALTLIFSLQRMRARKLAFWIPLVGGALSIVVLIGFSMAAISNVPELMQQFSDPDALTRLLDGLTSTR